MVVKRNYLIDVLKFMTLGLIYINTFFYSDTSVLSEKNYMAWLDYS